MTRSILDVTGGAPLKDNIGASRGEGSMNDAKTRRARAAETLYRDTYADRASARAELDHVRSESQIEMAQSALRMILETAEYTSDRTMHLSTNVAEGVKAGETLSAVARQIRTLSSNTSLEASRLGGSATVAEIARQMRLLSQQVTALSEHLSASLRSQNVVLGELSGAIDTLLADAAATQAMLARESGATDCDDRTPLLGLAHSVPESVATLEAAADG